MFIKNNYKNKINNSFSRKGFTLVEVVAVLGVTAVITAILLASNRLGEQQISLNKDAAGIASAVSRAKSLTLQNLTSKICGYGVHFGPTQSEPVSKKYAIFEITKAGNEVCDPSKFSYDSINNLPTQDSTASLGEGIIFYTPSTESAASNVLIKEVFFYSSDAKVKLMGVSNEICPVGLVVCRGGLVVIQTESSPATFANLKVTVTGQVTMKITSGTYYQSIDDFDNNIIGEGGGQEIQGGLGEEGLPEFGGGGGESCIPDCSCSAQLASGQTCSNGCGGICYAGCGSNCGGGCSAGETNPHNIQQDGNCVSVAGCGLNSCGVPPQPNCYLSTDCQAPNNTCADYDGCGAPCVVCGINQACDQTAKQCVACDCTGKTCGEIANGGCGLICPGPCAEGYHCSGSEPASDNQCVVNEVSITIDSVWPPLGLK